MPRRVLACLAVQRVCDRGDKDLKRCLSVSLVAGTADVVCHPADLCWFELAQR